MRIRHLVALAVAIHVGSVLAQSPASTRAAGNPLVRRYVEGETLRYVMKTVNRGRRYQAVATGVVRKDANGHFFEEFAWSDLLADDKPVALPAAGGTLRQQVSLEPTYKFSMPNLAAVDPNLIGPALDFLNFYVDLQLAIKEPGLTGAGSHVVVPRDLPNSWADGKGVILGEDAIYFDITLTAVNTSEGTAVVTVRHVPPSQVRVHLPAEWMRTPVADTPNNWVQVVRDTAGGYEASVGKETFDVRITVNLASGKILSATMDNPVQILSRQCKDAALSDCGAPTRYEIRRRIELTAQQ